MQRMQSETTQKPIMHNIYMTARESITRLVSKLVPPKEVEDIVQETYVKLCQLDRQNDIHQPRSFLLKTAKNLALDHLKKAETRLADGVDDETSFSVNSTNQSEDAIFDQAASDEEFSHFCEAIRRLPVQCRRVFVLKKVYGYSQREIVVETGLSESTVEKHIALGVKKCTVYMLKMGMHQNETHTIRAPGKVEARL